MKTFRLVEGMADNLHLGFGSNGPQTFSNLTRSLLRKFAKRIWIFDYIEVKDKQV